MEKSKRTVTLILIFLVLIGSLSFSVPAIHSQKQNLYEITVCTAAGAHSHFANLSVEEAQKVGEVLSSFTERISTVTSSSDALGLYHELFIDLDSYHLLGGLNEHQAFGLATRCFNDKTRQNAFTGDSTESKNMFCLMVGQTNNTQFIGPLGSVILMLNGGDGFDTLTWVFSAFNPLHIGSTIYLGGEGFSAHGAVWSLGLGGLKTWTKSFEGKLKNPPLWIQLPYPGGAHKTIYYPGVIGFSGLKIADWVNGGRTFFVGSAIFADINQL